MDWIKFVSVKLINDGFVLIDPEKGLGFSYLKIEDSEEIFGIVGMGKASIYKDVVEKNGLMWFEIVEIQKEVLSKVTQIKSNKILIPYDLLGKRASRAVLRFLSGSQIAMTAKSMKIKEFREFSPQCELWVQEIVF